MFPDPLGQTNLIFWVTDFFFADVTRQGGKKIIIIPQQISRLTFDPYFIDFCLNIFKKMYMYSTKFKAGVTHNSWIIHEIFWNVNNFVVSCPL